MQNNFITEKTVNAQKTSKTVLLVTTALFAAGSASTVFDYLRQRDYTQLGIDIVMTVGFCVWFAFLLRAKLRAAAAEDEANILAMYGVGEVSFSQVKKSFPDEPDIINKIDRNIKDGFLRGIGVDYAREEIVLGAKISELEKREIICPHCGAKNVVVIGRSSKCEYCDSLIMF